MLELFQTTLNAVVYGKFIFIYQESYYYSIITVQLIDNLDNIQLNRIQCSRHKS